MGVLKTMTLRETRDVMKVFHFSVLLCSTTVIYGLALHRSRIPFIPRVTYDGTLSRITNLTRVRG